MKDKLRIGVLGMTHDHLWGNLADLNASPVGELVAAADPHQELRDKAREQFDCPLVFESYEDLLQNVEVDAVYTYSDHVTSANLTVMAAEHGKHIMVEKAMAATLADAERMWAAASRYNVQLMVNWPFAWDPGLQKAIELVESGAIGRLFYVKHRGSHGGPMEFGHSHFFYDWLYDERLGGGGAIIDYGCYGAALARYLLGQPSKVSAVAGHLAKEYVTLDDNAIFVMQWPRAMAQMEASWTHIGRLDKRFSVFLGTQGTVRLQAFPEKSLTLATADDKDGTEVELTPLWRPYFYETGADGQSPLDAELSLGSDRYSDFLREMSEYLGVYVAYSKATDVEERFLGVKLSTRVLQKVINEDAVDVEVFYAQKPPPAPDKEAEILVIQADGKGVPMVLETPAEPKVRLGKGKKRGRKKEAIVTTVYTIACAPRTPEEVVASFFYQDQSSISKQATSKRTKPQNKHVWATLEGKDTALARLAKQVAPRQGSHILHKVALCDGCEALQSRIETRFPDFNLILDFIHPNEYLWKVANSLLGETNEQRTEWVANRTLQMLSGETKRIITEFRSRSQDDQCTSAQREKLTKTANYFERNLTLYGLPNLLGKGLADCFRSD